jgi:type II secretory pathway pseudopilin PulG
MGYRVHLQNLVRRQRSQQGAGIIDLLFCVIISGILSAAIVNGMSQAHRASSSSQNQVIAAAIAQEVIDSARNMPYNTLQTFVGTHDLVVNSGSGLTPPPVFPRPLMQDRNSLIWSSKAANNDFDATVTETIAAGPVANTLQVTVLVTWKENTGGSRTFTMTTLVSQFGIHT